MIHYAENLVRRVVGRRALPDLHKVPLTLAVEHALALPPLGAPGIVPDPALARLATSAVLRPVTIGSRELFSLDGKPLPGWREEDVGLEDDWVTTEQYYPLYHRFFQEITQHLSTPRLLEIGVRTGYVGMCFARGVNGPAAYVGVDPNLYLPDSLERAVSSFTLLATRIRGFRFNCLLGYSDNPAVQRKLRRLAPFDLIHIDGDHTLRGKLIDLDLSRFLLAPGGLVLVDDYTHIPAVIQESVSRALKLGWYSRFAVLETMRGMAILQR
jgi:predicted O-methyltransferase YrrM